MTLLTNRPALSPSKGLSHFPSIALILLLVTLSTAFAQSPTPSDAYTASIEAAHKERAEHLTKPFGWLSLIGLHYLKPGANTVGRAPDNQIVFAGGPDHFGTYTLAADGKVSFTPAAGANAHILDKPVTTTIDLPIQDEEPDAIRVLEDTLSVLLLERGGKPALRVKDSASARRAHFVGIDYFPTDPSWKIEATWIPNAAPVDVSITNVIGNTYTEKSPGKVSFKRDGKTYELIAIVEGPDEPLFFVFSDATSGKESYGMRFLDADPAVNGKVILDFNLATNPPCAFTPFATCPRPPKGNDLELAVTAGEKTYAGEHH